jgi:anti-sigma factor RsiW
MSPHLTEVHLNEYLDSAFDASFQQAAETHLAGCPGCRARLDELRRVFMLLAALPDEPLTADLAATVWEDAAPARPPANRRLALALVVQGSLAIILMAFVWPRLLPAFGGAGIGLPAEWSSRLLQQAVAFDAEAWVAPVISFSALASNFWQALTAAITWSSSSWRLVLLCAFAAWLTGNQLLLRNGHDFSKHGGYHD